MKKIISIVLSTIMAMSITTSIFAKNFPDVDDSANYSQAVEVLSKLGIVKGDDNGYFNPTDTVTRAEFTKMTVGALGEINAAEAQSTSKFIDTADSSIHWSAGYVAQGVADGFINGYDDNYFGPDDEVTYAQACKMLVVAIGYTYYAEGSGGYPAGYVSQASALDITKGVSATEDKPLTRAEVAIMITNAMDVPLCAIDTWEVKETLNGVTQVPIYKKLDGRENREYQSLFTSKHDAYKVKGRVIANSQGAADGLKKDEVKFNIEVADNFNDEFNIDKNNIRSNEIFKVGSTDAANMLFAYAEAIVQKDADTEEFTILSIKNGGNSRIVEFRAEDVSDEDTNYIANKKLPVYKTATSSTTTKYDLADNAIMYVNGVEAGVATDEMIKTYILDNPTGKVTLVDETAVGSTSTDGKYEYILVTYYVDAIVDYVAESSTKARVYFKQSQTSASKIEWDIEDEDIDITFTKNDTEISYKDLQEFDVISIQYDIVNEGTAANSLTDKEYYNIVVSSGTAEGNITQKDIKNNIVNIDGTPYDVLNTMVNTNDFELDSAYKAYVDAFGYIVYFEEGSSEKSYGVIVSMYDTNGDDYPTVRFITSNAKVVAYECKDADEGNKFYQYATGNTDTYKPFKKTDIADRIKSGATVCTYKVSNGKVRFNKGFTGVGGDNIEFKAKTNKLGSYAITDSTTKVIDMDAYINGNDTTVNTLSVNDFEDEANYSAYLFDKNSDSVYRFAIVFEGTSSIRPESQIAVIKVSNGQKKIDSVICNSYTVYKGNEEIEIFYEDEKSSINEGAVVAYTIGANGYIEKDDLYILYTPGITYEETYSNLINNDDFGNELNYVVKRVGGRYDGRYEIAYKGIPSSSKDILAYAGVVYDKTAKSVSIITSKYSGESEVNNAIDIDFGSANVYTFDYSERADIGSRLSIGNTATQKGQTTFRQGLINDNNTIVWNNLDEATPQLAFIREVDGEATDVIYYIAP